MRHPFEREVLRRGRDLLGPAQSVVVGVSGGPDSAALLAAMAAVGPDLGVAPVAAHLDHGLRGEAGRRDAAAAAALARRLGVPFVAGRAEARERASGSLEAAARAVRYRFLVDAADARGAARIATGHTASDQAETVLLRLLRGTGLDGLAAIPAERAAASGRPDLRVVRPLLDLTRADVLAYLGARGLPWVEDASNDDPRFLRNRLRHEVLPLLRRRVNPEVDDALLRLAGQARLAAAHLGAESAALLAAAAAEGEGAWRLDELRAAPPAVRGPALARLARRWAPERAAACHVEALERLVAAGEGAVDLPGGRAVAAAGDLRLAVAGDPPSSPPAVDFALGVPGRALDPEAGLEFATRIAPPPADVRVDPARRALLDADRVGVGRLGIRRRRPGDRFWPLGAPGSRSLKRFLIDRKVPRAQRAAVPIVTLDDRPVWIVGHRIDERFKVTPATTRVLEIEARSATPGEKEGRS